MNDLISRSKAVDRIRGTGYADQIKENVIMILMGLPSAQPDLDEWCDTCREYDSEKHCCPRYNRVIREAVEEMREEHD